MTQPDVLVTSETNVDYDPTWVVAPDVEINSTTLVEYQPPPSTGGQPDIVITSVSAIAYEEPVIYLDFEGSAEFVISARGRFDIEVELVSVPTGIEYSLVQRVSVKMPKPENLDRFGRPQ